MKKMLCFLAFFCILSNCTNAAPPQKLDPTKAKKMINHIKEKHIKRRRVSIDEFDVTELKGLLKNATRARFILGAYLKDEPNDPQGNKIANYPVIILELVTPAKTEPEYYIGLVCPPPDPCPYPITISTSNKTDKVLAGR